MEFVCRIFKSTKTLTALVYGIQGLRLPLFECNTHPIPSGIEGYTLYFYKEDRYSPYLIGVNPPKVLTEEQINTINRNWNKCIEDDLFEIEFEL